MHDLHTLSYKPFTGDFLCVFFYVVLITTVRSVIFSAGLASDSLDKELTELRAQVTELTSLRL